MIEATFRSITVIGLTCLLTSGEIEAQVVDGKQIVRAALITAAEDFRKPFTVGIHFTIEPDWYLYWKNPGDAGLPVDVRWELPKGFRAGEVQHPTPQKFVYDEVIAYGYKRELVLLVDIVPPPDFMPTASASLTAKLDWLVCKESCVRGKAEVSLPLSLLSRQHRTAAREMLMKFQSMLPRPAAHLAVSFPRATVSKTKEGHAITVTLAGRDADRVTDFFPEPMDEVHVDFRSIRVRDRRLTLVVTPTKAGSTLRQLRGLLIADGVGYECTIPLQTRNGNRP